MAWPELTLRDWDHFAAIVAHVDVGPVATFPHLFRGQSQSSWTLAPSLVRQLPRTVSESQATQIEEDCRRLFAEQAHHYLSAAVIPQPDNRADWWALMQHHGAPTRLLDWTTSIYVAAYFACVDDWHADGAIWLVHAKTVVDDLIADMSWRSRAKLFLRSPKHPLDVLPFNIFRPNRPSQRMVAQQGYFLVHNNLLTDIADFMDARLARHHASNEGEVYRKITIPKDLKPCILRQLKAANITAASLFPGLDGLGSSVRELAKLSVPYPRPPGVP